MLTSTLQQKCPSKNADFSSPPHVEKDNFGRLGKSGGELVGKMATCVAGEEPDGEHDGSRSPGEHTLPSQGRCTGTG